MDNTTVEETIRADVALREQLNRYFDHRRTAATIYHNRHELFSMFKDWATRIEQGSPTEDSATHE